MADPDAVTMVLSTEEANLIIKIRAVPEQVTHMLVSKPESKMITRLRQLRKQGAEPPPVLVQLYPLALFVCGKEERLEIT